MLKLIILILDYNRLLNGRTVFVYKIKENYQTDTFYYY